MMGPSAPTRRSEHGGTRGLVKVVALGLIPLNVALAALFSVLADVTGDPTVQVAANLTSDVLALDTVHSSGIVLAALSSLAVVLLFGCLFCAPRPPDERGYQ